jgi:hypothetical protein
MASNAASSAPVSVFPVLPPRIRTQAITLMGVDAPAVVQSLDMGKAVYVWCGVGEPRLADLVAAVPGGAAGAGLSSTPLMSAGVSDADEADSFARTLTLRLGRVVLLSWGLPASLPGAARVEAQHAVLAHLTAAAAAGSGAAAGAAATPA